MERGDILPLIRRNLARNPNVLSSSSVTVEELDFFSDSWRPELENLVLNSEVSGVYRALPNLFF